MKKRVGQTNDEVEIGQIREVNKGCLKASFSIVFYPSGLKISGCCLFAQGDKKWFTMPQREVKYTDGKKTDYFPYITYLNKEYEKQLKDAVLECLVNTSPQGSYDRQENKSSASTSQPSRVQAQSSFDFGAPPF